MSPALREWWPALLLAVVWGVCPALPTLIRGELLGQPYTDLYPSVWGLWAYGHAPAGGWAHTGLLGFPEGIGYYYASPIKGTLAMPLLSLFPVRDVWNLLTVLARVATPLCAYGAGRAWGLRPLGALTLAAAWGCSPTFHGYAVEGIVEGTDGWTLALWAWAAGKRRHGLSALALALTILSSWYLGAVGCLLAVFAGLRDRRAWGGLVLGLLLSAPALVMFLGAFEPAAPLSPEIRALMGARLQVPTPGVQSGLNPFAQTAYVGWFLGGALLVGIRSGQHRLALLAAIPAVLSLGWGPWYSLPVLSMLRFPYRWHLATLALTGLIAGRVADARRLWWLPLAIVSEGLLLAPVEPILPGAPADIPDIYASVDGPLLEVPGPVSRPPGEVNASRARARYLLYYQSAHHQPSPWAPDFNGLGAASPTPHLDPFRRFDRLESGPSWADHAHVSPTDLSTLQDMGVFWVMVQDRELGSRRSRALRQALEDGGAVLHAEDGARGLYRLAP